MTGAGPESRSAYSSEPPPEGGSGGAPAELPAEMQYELAIDAQVETFVEIKQKLTYFLITASVAVILFVVNFFVDHQRARGQFTAGSAETGLVMASALAGLATAGFALLALRLEHRSHEWHLGFRYRRQTIESLSPEQTRSWNRLAPRAAIYRNAAFASLFTELGLAVAFFIVFFW
jgi:hypothetical protein